jgi:hypothetical protein
MAESRTARTAAQPRLGWRIAAIVGAVFAVFALFQDLDWLAGYAGLTTHGDYGFTFSQVPGSPNTARVTAVVPGSPAAVAGLAPGDIGTLLSTPGLPGPPAIGAAVRVRVNRAGRQRDLTLVAAPSHRFSRLTAQATQGHLLGLLADLPAVLLGLFVLVRGGGQPATVLLGVALAAFGLTAPDIASPSITAPALKLAAMLIGQLSMYAMRACLLAFGLRMLHEAAGRRWRWERPAFAVALIALAAGWSILEVGFYQVPVPFEVLKAQAFTGVVYVVELCAGLACLAAGWAMSPAAQKPRFALLMLASACVFANQAANDVIDTIFHDFDGAMLDSWPLQVANILAGVVAPVLFAYAILRHRVLDLGFAVNRTLVYSAVSAIMLGAFGLIEWAFDHFVKIQGREQNALIDAAIALGVYLAFHRVTGFVEHGVEALFFRRWQEKAQELRRYVADAAFVTRRTSLLAGFADALSRFADGAAAAVYLMADSGGYARAAGDSALAPKTLDDDDPALVRLRAERKPVEPDATGSPLKAVLACPMLHRGELIGVVLLAARAQGAGYRPDEAELLGWATLQVGLDLHALEVERLQAAVTRLEHQLEGARLTARPA